MIERSTFLTQNTNKTFTFASQSPMFINLASTNANMNYNEPDNKFDPAMSKRKHLYLTLSFPEYVNKYSIQSSNMLSNNFIADIPPAPKVNHSIYGDSYSELNNRDIQQLQQQQQQALQMKKQLQLQMKQMQKMQKQQSFYTFKFDTKARKTFNKFEATSSEMQEEFVETANETTSIMYSMKQLLSDQGKFIAQISTDFQQQAAQVARSIQGTVADIDTTFRTAMNSITSHRSGIIPPPPSPMPIPQIQPISQTYIPTATNSSLVGAIQPFQPSPFFIQPPIVSSNFKEQPFRRSSKRNSSKANVSTFKANVSSIRSRAKNKIVYDESDHNENESDDYNDLIDSTDESASFVDESTGEIKAITNANNNNNNKVPSINLNRGNQNIMSNENNLSSRSSKEKRSNSSLKSSDSVKKSKNEIALNNNNNDNNINSNVVSNQVSKNAISKVETVTKKILTNKSSFQSLLEDQSDSMSD